MSFLRQVAGSRRPLIVAVAPACLGALDLPAPAALAGWQRSWRPTWSRKLRHSCPLSGPSGISYGSRSPVFI